MAVTRWLVRTGDLVAEGLVDEVGILEAAAELLASAEALTGSTVS